MASTNTPDTQALVLDFDDRAIWSPGQNVQGNVSIDLALAQKEGIGQVRVDFRGSIETAIAEPVQYTGDNQPVAAYRKRTAELFQSTQPLWTMGNEASHNSGVIARAFRFQLPESLPPSFFFNGSDVQARIEYSIEVVGTRADTGLRNKDRHIARSFTVFPVPSPAQLSVGQKLQSGWGGPWRKISHGQKIRRGIFGGHSHVHAEVKLPDFPSIPRATEVPLIFTVETRTKLMERGEPPEDEAMFPAPPTHLSDVALTLEHTVHMAGEYASRTSSNACRVLGGLGDPASSKAVKRYISPPEWIPEPGHKKNHGVWKRVVRFESTISISETPTFKSEVEGKAFELQYSLRFLVEFLGIGNNLELEVPITIHSAHEWANLKERESSLMST
ncbi:hypothetical protein FB451DRAFT_588255 [Mycena latifolia]|nr:hypothetical protein FB451DRAFT_588255 [Mycena latifolia]